MTPPSNTTVPSIEQGVNALVGDVKQKVHHTYDNFEQRVRETPGQAVLVAVAAGYLLHRLPIRSLLVSQTRLVTALAPPALLAFGAAKLCEFLQKQARKSDSPRSSSGDLGGLRSFDAPGDVTGVRVGSGS